MPVPILDDDYMRRRANERYFIAWADSMRRIRGYGSALDTPESLRDEYAAGKIDYDELSRRLDRILAA